MTGSIQEIISATIVVVIVIFAAWIFTYLGKRK